MAGMHSEHSARPDSETPFLRSVGGQLGASGATYATPKEEWLLVVEPEEDKQYGSGRVGTPLAVYEALMREKNAALASKRHAELIIEEVVGARLYTGCALAALLLQSIPDLARGRCERHLPSLTRTCPVFASCVGSRRPMFEKYNFVLRLFTGPTRYSASELALAAATGRRCPSFLQAKCVDFSLGKWSPLADGGLAWEWDNMYPTTIRAEQCLDPPRRSHLLSKRRATASLPSSSSAPLSSLMSSMCHLPPQMRSTRA